MGEDAPPSVLADGRNRRRSRTRTALMMAGQQLFAANPVVNVSIDDIVDAAAVAKGSFYNHFDDKEAFADAIYDHVYRDAEAQIFSVNQGVDDPAARVARALCTALVYARDHPEQLQALLSLAPPRGTSADSALNAGISADVGSGLGAARFSLVDLETGVLVVIGAVTVAMTHIMFNTVRDEDRLAANMAAAMLRALGLAPAEADAVACQAVTDILHKETPR